MTPPLISVLIDTYNHERYIEQAIVSVLEQDFPREDLEIVVVDDGSTDRTPEIVRKFAPRVRLLRKKNGGQASAFNVGIPETHAQYVAFLDGDDWWAKEKARTALDILERNPGLAAVGHGYFEVRGDAPPTTIVIPEQTCLLDLSSSETVRLADYGRLFLGTSMITIRRRILDQVMPVPEELIFCADAPMLHLALALGGAIVLDKPLFYWRVHSENRFMLDAENVEKSRRRYDIYAHLHRILSERLADTGASPEMIAEILQRDWLEVERFRLCVDGGSRRRTFRAERLYFRSTYKNPSPGYRLFEYFVAALTLLLPPRRFYQLRAWYGRRNLKRVRAIIASAELTNPRPFIQRRTIVPADLENAASLADRAKVDSGKQSSLSVPTSEA